MVTVFDVFELTDYVFLEVSRGGVAGNLILSQTAATGVFKLRSQMVRGENAETKESNATLHIKPDEWFADNLIGHGVTVDRKDYEIIGVTGGMNYHTGIMEHYTATLQEVDYSDWEYVGSS